MYPLACLLLVFVVVGCVELVPPACRTGSWDRVATAAEWDAAADLVGIQGQLCPQARVMLVDDLQADDLGMGERSDIMWWSGITFACGEGQSTVTLLRSDGIEMHAHLLTHELVHAAIACESGGSFVDEGHAMQLWATLPD